MNIKRARISSGISQIGGKFRLLKKIIKRIPYHEFYLEPFLGGGIILINKHRCRYECGNDINSELINYLLVASGWDKGVQEFQMHIKPSDYDAKVVMMYEEMKQGVLGLVSQEVCNRIVRGELIPKNNIERAYFFYYLNKLTFAGASSMKQNGGYAIEGGVYGNKLAKPFTEEKCSEIKSQYSGILNNFALGTIKEKQVQEAKVNYSLQPSGFQMRQPQIDKAKVNYGGLVDAGSKNSYGRKPRKDEVENIKEEYKQAQIKGINPKTTRPYTNNDCGLLSPLQPKAINRLRYVNLTCYPFAKVYNMFYQAFHVRKGLGEECFLYIDPPYPNTEKYYGTGFGMEDHLKLIKLMIDSPFHILLSIGVGEECSFYIDALKEADWIVEDAWVKHSTDANSQVDKQEFLCMNYDITKLPLMQFSTEQNILTGWL